MFQQVLKKHCPLLISFLFPLAALGTIDSERIYSPSGVKLAIHFTNEDLSDYEVLNAAFSKSASEAIAKKNFSFSCDDRPNVCSMTVEVNEQNSDRTKLYNFSNYVFTIRGNRAKDLHKNIIEEITKSPSAKNVKYGVFMKQITPDCTPSGGGSGQGGTCKDVPVLVREHTSSSAILSQNGKIVCSLHNPGGFIVNCDINLAGFSLNFDGLKASDVPRPWKSYIAISEL